MGNRRMFSANEIQSDDFLELSYPAQVLYFNLAVSADDEGFLTRIKGIERLSGTSENELNELVRSGFIIRFDSGVCVIANWYANNLIRKDRFHETTFKTEKNQLIVNDNQWYTMRQPIVSQTVTSGVLKEPKEPKEPNEPNELKESKEFNKFKEPKTTRNSENQHPSNSDIPEDTIRTILTRNGNDVNSFVRELTESKVDISQDTMKLIGKISKELRSGPKNKVVSLDQIASSD